MGGLLRDVASEHLVSSARVVRVERNADDESFYLHVVVSSHSPSSPPAATPPSTDTTETTRFGPYRIVVGADGVNSVIRRHALRGTYLIGDARWAKDRWYDMGLRRIRRGADTAMNDGMMLGRLIVEGEERCGGEGSGGFVRREGCEESSVHSSSLTSSAASQYYCARDISERELRRRRIGYVVAVAIFALYHSVISRYSW